MWGGRFSQKPADIMEAINVSLPFDKRFYTQDIQGSKAHAAMLLRVGLITADDEQAIQDGLDTILTEIENGTFPFRTEYEDIHMNIEARLAELIGAPAGRLHTARSRNDQVATDARLWLRATIDAQSEHIRALRAALLNQAEQHIDTIMAGFTHLQPAQPVTFAHHCMAYVEMFGRDASRLQDCRARLNECPLGAAALAGTSFPINREMTAHALGFSHPMRNSLDAVSSRDFMVEYLAAASIASMHLSRLAEELVLWSTPQFNFISLSDAFSTGSSIMPQKKNPDAAELIRGKTGRVYGALHAMLTLLKSLPLAYSKDMQEDKEALFDAADTLSLCVQAMTGMIRDMTVNKDALRASADGRFATATDLADWLVRTLNMPFREAHHVTGQLVKHAETLGCTLSDLPLSTMQSVCAGITQDIFNVLTVDSSVESRTSFGGTSPSVVRLAIAAAKATL